MYQIKTAGPGVRVICVNTEKFKKNIVKVSMAVPLDEKASANALLIRLLSRSSRDYPDFTLLNAKKDELYGAEIGFGIGKTGDAQVLSLYIKCIDDRFSLNGESIVDECTRLLVSMIFKPNAVNHSFGKQNLETEKRLLTNEILEEQDDKRFYAKNKCISYICENEPYGRDPRGTVEEINAVKMKEVYDAWKELLETAVVQITAVGSGNIDSIVSVFESQFSQVGRNPCSIKTVFTKKAGRFRRYEERDTINQGKLVIGYRTAMANADDDYYSYYVMTDIFGGGTYSKLFTNVREKMSLAYYCSAMLIRTKGLVIVQCGIDTDKEKTTSAAIINQLNDIRNGKFDEETLNASKRSIRERLTFSNPDAIANWYDTQILDETVDTPDDMYAGIEKVTADDVKNAASKLYLDKIFMLASAETGEDKNED